MTVVAGIDGTDATTLVRLAAREARYRGDDAKSTTRRAHAPCPVLVVPARGTA